MPLLTRRVEVACAIGLALGGCGGRSPSNATSPSTLETSAPTTAPEKRERIYRFDTDKAGRLPAGLSFLQPPPGSGFWKIEAVPIAQSVPNALAWNPQGNGEGRALALDLPGPSFHLSVQVRAGSGDAAQTQAGLLFGYQDSANHWGAVLDFAAARSLLYRVENGVRTNVAEAVFHPAGEGGAPWHHLEVDCRAGAVQCRVNGSSSTSAQETRAPEGRAGLVVCGGGALFDDLTITPR